MAESKNSSKQKSNIIVDESLDSKYKDVTLFPEKYNRAMEHLKNRDIQKEIDKALNEEKKIK